ncbi:MAG: hypothetical protein AAF791_14695, partial [Bacteroidota bacterium]
QWWDAVTASDAYRDLRLVADGDRPASIPLLPQSYADYLLEPWELWARSYAQYIAQRSGDPTMRSQIAGLRSDHPLKQWSDDDFEPIADVIDSIFRDLQWIP